jgi:hypothetical protein
MSYSTTMLKWVLLLILCTACTIENNWVVVERDWSGTPFRCWELYNVWVSPCESCVEVSWEERNGNRVRITGNVTVVRVASSWESAFKIAGIDRKACKYLQNLQATYEDVCVGKSCPSAFDFD